MADFIIWLIVSGFVMMVLYACYSVMLAGQRQPAFNRTILLGIYILSFSLFFIFRLFKHLFISTGHIVVTGVCSISKADIATGGWWLKILLMIYVSGAVIVLLRCIWGYMSLFRILAKGERIKRKDYVLVISEDDEMAAFSWWKYIVINRKDYGEDAEMILVHERSHLDHHHWLDLIVADLALIVEWFNPAAWMMRDELKETHEFQADEQVVQAGYDPQMYQLMLISKAVGKRVSFVGNSFNHGKLKRRLTMMNRQCSTKLIRSRVAVMLPVIILLSISFNSSLGQRFCTGINLMVSSDKNIVRVKGGDTESPVIILNGKEMPSGSLNDINPSEIKSISVRKDQSKNGTIYIETK